MRVDRHRFASFDFRAEPTSPASAPGDARFAMRREPAEAPRATARSGWWPFPGLIFLLLATNISIVSITALYAVSDKSFAVEPEYYKQAVNWDQTMAQRARNRELGWTATMASSVSGQAVVLLLHDDKGAPVSGARVEMVAFHNAHSGNRLSASLTEIDPGVYRSTESLVRSGSWEVRLTATRADQTFTAITPHDVRAKEGAP